MTASNNDTKGAEATPRRPTNVTVKLSSPTSALVSWHVNTDERTHYEITYKPVHARNKVVAEVDGRDRSVLLERLQPTTVYQVQVAAVSASGSTNATQTVFFDTGHLTADGLVSTTTAVASEPYVTGKYPARGEEIGIVVLVLALWVFVILLFINKWGKIRMLEPYQPQYKQSRAASCQLLHGQHLGSHVHLDQMHVSMSALFERERMMSVAHMHHLNRPRQNSVFVGSIYSTNNLQQGYSSRKVKSAEDLKSMTLKCNDQTIETTVM